MAKLDGFMTMFFVIAFNKFKILKKSYGFFLFCEKSFMFFRPLNFQISCFDCFEIKHILITCLEKNKKI